MNPLPQGVVISAYGKRYNVSLPDGNIISCVTRGKKSELACGDHVEIQLTDTCEGVVEKLLPRSSLLYRSNDYRKKLLAANVTQIIIVLAARPTYYPELLDRCLLAAEVENIRPLILLNKADLSGTAAIQEKLDVYQQMGYPVLAIVGNKDVTPLLSWLNGHTSVLVGQSGMGKSTLVNSLLPNARIRTREISQSLDSGKHTTTAAQLYQLDSNSQLIDSPGLQEFGLAHLKREQIEYAFIEFRPFLGKCRFNDCKHLKEPDCALHQALDKNMITRERLLCYHKITTNMD